MQAGAVAGGTAGGKAAKPPLTEHEREKLDSRKKVAKDHIIAVGLIMLKSPPDGVDSEGPAGSEFRKYLTRLEAEVDADFDTEVLGDATFKSELAYEFANLVKSKATKNFKWQPKEYSEAKVDKIEKFMKADFRRRAAEGKRALNAVAKANSKKNAEAKAAEKEAKKAEKEKAKEAKKQQKTGQAVLTGKLEKLFDIAKGANSEDLAVADRTLGQALLDVWNYNKLYLYGKVTRGKGHYIADGHYTNLLTYILPAMRQAGGREGNVEPAAVDVHEEEAEGKKKAGPQQGACYVSIQGKRLSEFVSNAASFADEYAALDKKDKEKEKAERRPSRRRRGKGGEEEKESWRSKAEREEEEREYKEKKAAQERSTGSWWRSRRRRRRRRRSGSDGASCGGGRSFLQMRQERMKAEERRERKMEEEAARKEEEAAKRLRGRKDET
eukprot:jgi/Mesvir1/28430/Mv15855-RA.1